MIKMFSFLIAVLCFLILSACSSDTIKEIERFHAKQEGDAGIYLTLNGVYAKLNQIKQKYGEQVRLFEIGRSSKLNQPVPLLRIGNKARETTKRFLFVAGTHGDEAAAVAALCFTMDKILSEGLIDTLLQKNIVVDFIPVHNPDGYSENERENGTGKDINRNFPIGYVERKTEPETIAMINLINQTKYMASLFFHSANEQKYENLVRLPVEFKRLGEKAFKNNFRTEMRQLRDIVVTAGNKGQPVKIWSSSSDMVNAAGISSDWCVSGFIVDSLASIVQTACVNSHPSLTVEICYPKQPMDEAHLLSEKKETFRIVRGVLLEFRNR